LGKERPVSIRTSSPSQSTPFLRPDQPAKKKTIGGVSRVAVQISGEVEEKKNAFIQNLSQPNVKSFQNGGKRGWKRRTERGGRNPEGKNEGRASIFFRRDPHPPLRSPWEKKSSRSKKKRVEIGIFGPGKKGGAFLLESSVEGGSSRRDFLDAKKARKVDARIGEGGEIKRKRSLSPTGNIRRE